MSEVPLYREQRFRGGFVFKTRRLLYHSTLVLKVIKKREEEGTVDSVPEAEKATTRCDTSTCFAVDRLRGRDTRHIDVDGSPTQSRISPSMVYGSEGEYGLWCRG